MTGSPVASRSGRGHVEHLGPPVVLVLLTALPFLPALGNQFVSWDDFRMFRDNLHYRGLGLQELRWMWTTFHYGEFMPLTWMTYGLDAMVWGQNPVGYHLTSLALHVLAVLTVYALARLLLEQAWPRVPAGPIVLSASLAALVFGIHPLRAEPVAWASARGSVLGGLLALATVLTYVRTCVPSGPREPRGGARRRWYLAALGCFALALLARSTNVVLPLVLLILDVYPLRRWGPGAGGRLGGAARRVWWEKLPFLAIAVAVVPLALAARRLSQGQLVARIVEDPTVGLAASMFGLAFPLWKMVTPGDLSPLYERPPRLDPLDWPYLVAGAVVVSITVCLVLVRRRWPAGLAAWLCWAVLLGPTLGLVPFGLQLAADRYTYVAGVGWAILVGAGALQWHRLRVQGRVGHVCWLLSLTLASTGLIAWGVMTSRQVTVWRDSETLWRQVVAVQPRSAAAHVSLGAVYLEAGQLERAREHYDRARGLWPHDADLHAAVGRVLVAQGKPGAALAPLREALRLVPAHRRARLALGQAHLLLGDELVAGGRLGEGIAAYEEAIRADPALEAARSRLGALRHQCENLRARRGAQVC